MPFSDKIMRKVILIMCSIALMLCYMSNALALAYDTIKIGMDYQEVVSLLKDFDVPESDLKNEELIITDIDDQRIVVSFTENEVTRVRYKKAGKQESSIDLFSPDWMLTPDGIIGVLNENGLEYSYSIRPVRNKSAKRYVQDVNFYGCMDSIPAIYYLSFDQEGILEEVSIVPSYRKADRAVSNMFSFMAFAGEMLGQPESANVADYVPLSEDDGIITFYDSCYWLKNGLKYQMDMETLIEQYYEENEEPSIKEFDRSISLTITTYDE